MDGRGRGRHAYFVRQGGDHEEEEEEEEDLHDHVELKELINYDGGGGRYRNREVGNVWYYGERGGGTARGRYKERSYHDDHHGYDDHHDDHGYDDHKDHGYDDHHDGYDDHKDHGYGHDDHGYGHDDHGYGHDDHGYGHHGYHHDPYQHHKPIIHYGGGYKK